MNGWLEQLRNHLLYKTVDKTILIWSELEEVLLDVETVLNNRPLRYVEDDTQMPDLTSNSPIYESSMILEDDSDNIDKDHRKRAQFIKKCKKAVWSRWRLMALRERHSNLWKEQQVKVGDVVIKKWDQRNLWKLGLVEKLILGKDGVVRAVQVRDGKSIWKGQCNTCTHCNLSATGKITLYQLRNDRTSQIQHLVRNEQQLLLPISQLKTKSLTKTIHCK